MRGARVLVADDEKNLRELLVRELARLGHAAEGVPDGLAAMERLAAATFDVLVLDMKMPRLSGIEVLRWLAGTAPEGAAAEGESAAPTRADAPQVIVMTGFQEVSTAVEAMKLGAYDYLTKPARLEELEQLVVKAAEKARLLRDNDALRAQLLGAEAFGGIVTRSPSMQEILRQIDRVAPTDSAVLVLGESGTGKELVSRAIHERSLRYARPFVPIDCGALPREVLESELFGHEKGAYTGAITAKPGLVELADGGTLLLDEIGEMALDSQARFLRVLETGTFFRVGGTRSRTVDVRVIASTNRDLAEAIARGSFRQDLLYRINTIALTLPPLRERREDIALLADHFLRESPYGQKKQLTPAALALLEAAPWPGNVRQLKHALERASILGSGAQIQPADLPADVLGAIAPARSGAAGPGAAGALGGTAHAPVTLEELERRHIEATLRQVGGHRGKAATVLGIDTKTLYRKMLAYGLGAGSAGN